MGFISMRAGFPIALVAASACTVLNAGNADAVLVFEFIQQGSDVALNVSGSLSGLPPVTRTNTLSCDPRFVIPRAGFICTFPSPSINADTYNISLATSTVAFGTAGFTGFPYIGDPTLLDGSSSQFLLASGYIEGTPISGTGLIAGTTLAALGIGPSGLLTSWAIGSDLIEIYSGPAPQPSSVPGPLPLFGAAAAFAHSRRLRARLRASSSPQA